MILIIIHMMSIVKNKKDIQETLQTNLNEETVNIKIIYKKNKNIYFRFDNEKNLIVTTPLHTSTKKILQLIKENEKALTKMLERTKRKIDNNNEIRLLGLKYEIKIDETYKDIVLDNGIIYAKNEKILNKYITNLTQKTFIEEINKVLKQMPNIPKFILKIRKMKSRWGVCNYIKKTVTLNSELIKYERRIIDYVIIHEFSHFTHHNHGSEFWNLVSTYYPEYKKARKELRET